VTTSYLQSILGEFAFHVSEDNLRIRSDQIRARLSIYPVMILSQIILEPLCVALFWGQANHLYLLAWLAGMYSVHSTIMLFWWFYREQIVTIKDCNIWSRRFKYLTMLTALGWGMMSALFFPPDWGYQALMLVVVIGLVAGSISLDSVYPPSLYIFVLGVTIPMITRLIIAGGETHLILAIMLIVYTIGEISSGRTLSKTFWKSLWQRYENDKLIEQLTIQKAIAEAANRDKSHFLATASHDLRQPLQAMVLFNEALQEVAIEKETQHLAEQIGKSVEALVDMFDELLDISKFDAGMVKAVKQHFLLQDVFDRLQTEFLPLANDKNLRFNMIKTSAMVYSDPNLLERILRNLISNAIRYTDYGEVKVVCNNENGLLMLDVVDTGVGIKPENIPYIFDEYYQVSNQNRDRLKGLGLGLAIVRRMELLLDCHITVISEPGLGSAFSFEIPQGDLTQFVKTTEPPKTKHDLTGVIVALVEDNNEIRKIASSLLKKWGCIVIDGDLPDSVFRPMINNGTRPDILICDYRLPQNLTAIDAINELKALWQWEIPALVLTGDTAPETLHKIQSSGALLLHKPIAPARLRSSMYFALNKANDQLLGGKLKGVE